MHNMSDRRQFQETRTAVLKRHVEAFLNRTGTSKERFAALVVDHFNATYPPAVRGIKPFADEINGTAPSQVLNTNKTRLFRYLEGALPSNLEESVRAQLDEQQRKACLDELAQREDLLAVPDFTRQQAADPCAAVVRVMQECTEAISAASKHATGEECARIVARETREAIAALTGLLAAVEGEQRPVLRVAK